MAVADIQSRIETIYFDERDFPVAPVQLDDGAVSYFIPPMRMTNMPRLLHRTGGNYAVTVGLDRTAFLNQVCDPALILTLYDQHNAFSGRIRIPVHELVAALPCSYFDEEAMAAWMIAESLEKHLSEWIDEKWSLRQEPENGFFSMLASFMLAALEQNDLISAPATLQRDSELRHGIFGRRCLRG